MKKVFTKIHDDTAPIAPGMLSRHYAPLTDTYLTNDVEKFIQSYPNKKIGLLLFQNQIKNINSDIKILASFKNINETEILNIKSKPIFASAFDYI